MNVLKSSTHHVHRRATESGSHRVSLQITCKAKIS